MDTTENWFNGRSANEAMANLLVHFQQTSAERAQSQKVKRRLALPVHWLYATNGQSGLEFGAHAEAPGS